MAATKKTLPFSRLRYSRSRKNGPELKKAATKSSTPNESSISHKPNTYPLHFTVDDLASTRRKKIPGKLPDSLRPLSGKFGDYKSEYKKKFRSFIIPSENTLSNWKKKKMRLKEQGLKPEGEIEFNVEYYDSFIEFPLQKQTRTKPRDQWENFEPAEFSSSTEHKEKYVMFKEARRAVLTRQSTNLKIEGDFQDSTENKEKYVIPQGIAKPPLTRRNTTLKLEGEIALSTENNEKYKEFIDVPRTKLIRRYSNLEIPSQAIISETEYQGSYTNPQNVQRAHLIRSMENLHTEGKMQFESEYEGKYIDFHVTPPDIKFRRRNRTECEIKPVQHEKNLQLHVSDTLRDGTAKRNPSPEYKHSFIRYPVQRPNFRRPSSNLTPPIGIGEKESELNAKYKPFPISHRTGSLRPSTHLKPEGEITLLPEYKSSFVDFSDEKSFPRPYHEHGCTAEKSFSVLNDKPDELNKETFIRSADRKFQRGKRLPALKRNDQTNSETSESEINQIRPPFRMEVTNPDANHKSYDRFKYDRPFVVLDENNNENQWVRNKQKYDSERWCPSWIKP